jgi:magnesium-transporting ATPase (P-type)
MSVVRLHINGKTYQDGELDGLSSSGVAALLVNSFCVNSDASLVPNVNPDWPDEQKGSRTECAMIGLSKRWKFDYEQIRSKYPSLNRVPFDSKWKWMASIADVEGERTIFLKGASERVIDLCEFIYDQGQIQSFSPEQKEAMKRDIVLPYARDTLRTIGLAYRQDNGLFPEAFYYEDKMDEKYITSNMVFLGVVGIKDPIRPEVPAAVKIVQRAGVKVRMVTGDNIETAMAIAKECGILDKNFQRREGEYYVMEGNDFAKQVGGLEDDPELKVKVVSNMNAFRRIIPQLSVLARSAPEHKFILVTGLKQMDRVVAVTGDGSNDAPALKKSNVGFAMNIAGTQLAKDAADIILIDDNFASIVTALKWGRNIYDCIRKFIQFQITVNIVALTMCVVGAIFLHYSPLTAVQMLWVNLIMDTFAALALATEPPSKKLLKRKPYGKKESMINAEMKRQIVGAAIYQVSWLMVLLFLGPDLFGVEAGWESRAWTEEGGRHFTIFFNAFVFMQVFNEINCRKLKASEFNVFKGFCNNSLFLLISITTIIAQILIVQFGGALLRCSRLTVIEHLYCVGIGMGSLVWILLLKWFPAKICTSWKLDDEEKAGAKGLNLLLRRDTTRSKATQQAFMKGMMRMKTK